MINEKHSLDPYEVQGSNNFVSVRDTKTMSVC